MAAFVCKQKNDIIFGPQIFTLGIRFSQRLCELDLTWEQKLKKIQVSIIINVTKLIMIEDSWHVFMVLTNFVF